MHMLNSTHTLVSPTPTTLERYLLEFESSMSVSFVSEYSRKLQTNLELCLSVSAKLLKYWMDDLWFCGSFNSISTL